MNADPAQQDFANDQCLRSNQMTKHVCISLIGICLLAAGLNAQQNDEPSGRRPVMSPDAAKFFGRWSGTRTERNPVTGLPFTLNFEFEFRQNGTYTERAGFGRLIILELEGRYTVQRISDRRDPSATHSLELTPSAMTRKPTDQDLRAMMIAEIPNVEPTRQLASFYDLAPAGGLTLRDARPGSETWGLQRLP
jgi:hypothetical protein